MDLNHYIYNFSDILDESVSPVGLHRKHAFVKNIASNQNQMSAPSARTQQEKTEQNAAAAAPAAVAAPATVAAPAAVVQQANGIVQANRKVENAPINKQKALLNNLKNKINEANRAFPDAQKYCNKNSPSSVCEQYILTRMGTFRKLTMKASNLAKKAASIAVVAVGTVGAYVVKLEQSAAAMAAAATAAAAGAIVAGGREALALAAAAGRTTKALATAIANDLTLSEEHRKQLEDKIAEMYELIKKLKLPEFSLDIVKTLTEIRRCAGEIVEILKAGAIVLLIPLGFLVPRFDYFLKKDPLTGLTRFKRNLKSIKKRLGNFGRRVGTFGRSVKSRAILAGLAAQKAISGSFAQMKATMERLSGIEQARLVKQLMEKVAKLESQGIRDVAAMGRLQDAIAAVSPEVVAQAQVSATAEEQAAINAAMRATPRASNAPRPNIAATIGTARTRNTRTLFKNNALTSNEAKAALASGKAAANARKAQYGNKIAAAEEAAELLRIQKGPLKNLRRRLGGEEYNALANLTPTLLANGQSMPGFGGGSRKNRRGSRKNRSRKNRRGSRKNRKGSRKH